MKDAQKPDHISLITLIGRLKEGRFVIPDFQRDFEWKPWDIRDLIRSIFQDYYIGSLLLWKGKKENFESLACEKVYGFPHNEGKPEHIVLDGQQRLTAMHYVFCAPDVPLPQRNSRYLFFVRVDKFMDELHDEAFEYYWTRWAFNLLEDKNAQFESHLFPLAIMGRGGFDLPNWVQEYEAYWRTKANESTGSNSIPEFARHADRAKEFGLYLKELTEQYQIAYIELERDIEIDKVCDIFTQINSKGAQLDTFDLINALLKPKGIQLKLMWREAAPKLEFVESNRMDVYVLQVMSILRQSYCSPKYLYYLMPGQERQLREPDGSLRSEVLIKTPDEFVDRWNEAVNALELSIGLLSHAQEFGAIAPQFLPYASILPAFTALQLQAKSLPTSKQLDAQRKIRQWYWASVFTSRYSGSVETMSARDFLAVKAWFDEETIEPAPIDEFRSRFRSLDLWREVKHGSSIYNGIINLLVINGARDWITGNLPVPGDLDDHHIVPKDWGNTNKLGGKINTVLNRTPLTRNTNRTVIGSKLPNEYLPELIKSNGEISVRQNLETHFISSEAFNLLMRNPFTPQDYEAFVETRKETLLEGIENLLIKQRIDLPVRLRELDEGVEIVERGLREVVNGVLQGDFSQLPSHVQQKINERMQQAYRRNPALDQAHYETLIGKLEYSDLRELEDVLVNKGVWPLVENRFGTKEILSTRFTQLAELRNSISHNRTVSEVVSKEGEASILWFKKILNNKNL